MTTFEFNMGKIIEFSSEQIIYTARLLCLKNLISYDTK